jgi:hypothetical protein
MEGRNSDSERQSRKKVIDVEKSYIRASFAESKLKGQKQRSFISNASVGIRASQLNAQYSSSKHSNLRSSITKKSIAVK